MLIVSKILLEGEKLVYELRLNAAAHKQALNLQRAERDRDRAIRRAKKLTERDAKQYAREYVRASSSLNLSVKTWDEYNPAPELFDGQWFSIDRAREIELQRRDERKQTMKRVLLWMWQGKNPPSLRSAAEILGISLSSVKRYRSELKASGLLPSPA